MEAKKPYLLRLIHSAILNPIFESNNKGSYAIRPQHNEEFKRFSLLKNKKEIALLLFFKNGIISVQAEKCTPYEQQSITKAILSLYPHNTLMIRTIHNS